jgi:hypothetical protein
MRRTVVEGPLLVLSNGSIPLMFFLSFRPVALGDETLFL